MRDFTKAVWNALLEKAATILITVLVSGVIGGCNHAKIVDTNKWVGEHLQDKQQQINQLKKTP